MVVLDCGFDPADLLRIFFTTIEPFVELLEGDFVSVFCPFRIVPLFYLSEEPLNIFPGGFVQGLLYRDTDDAHQLHQS